ncbi:MAG: TIM barrel protein [Spirochaetales bacterium]|nr:TIM barrel protein [Spirochaetales bacterium]
MKNVQTAAGPRVLVSRFVEDPMMDLSLFEGTAMQVAFYRRRVFRYFDHRLFKQRLHDAGIQVESVHAPAMDVYHQANDEFMTTLRTIREVYGVEVITIHPQRGDKRQARAYYRKLDREIRAMGITLAYETFEKEAMNTKWISQLKEMHEYFDLMDFPFLGITYDFTHGDSLTMMDEVRMYHRKIQVIHLSDALSRRPLDGNEYHQHLPLGRGDYPVEQFLDLLTGLGYRHFVVLEYHPCNDHLLRHDAAAVDGYLHGEREGLLAILEQRRRGQGL